jgi:(p)ppGpp synthase/HD superfamily hydrolase
MNIVARATLFASLKHSGKVRKFSGLPYISHPVQVLQTVREVTSDKEILAAAVLHDVIEDCDVTYTDLAQEFGERVASLVYEVTDAADDSDGDRATKAFLNRAAMSNASAEAQTIKLADIISNLSWFDIALKCDPSWARVYLVEKIDMINTLTKGDASLKKRALTVAARLAIKT